MDHHRRTGNLPAAGDCDRHHPRLHQGSRLLDRHHRLVLGVAVPYAVGNVVLTVLGPIVVAATFSG
ncbi:hypothetical protein [Bradyrhizobium sp. Rc2d]|uniref:hypothetical protein n=1 Tax=Bradyrhizobium sp. Rc2d TaxID=1855321 RepID=UPI000AC20A7F|nr:hypothetical protein [Bradyrhizobium sp. Rc2d]